MQEEMMYQDPNAAAPMMPMYGDIEGKVNNIVSQIDPQNAIDNLDHQLKGERWSKERAEWIKVSEPIANDACRAAVLSILSTVLLNNTTMAHVDEKQLSNIMEGIFKEVKRTFIQNLELFGFVPPGKYYEQGDYYNKGMPDTNKMNQIAEEVYRTAFLTLTRALRGKESAQIFRSLKMMDNLSYGGMSDEKKAGWIGRLFGKR